MFSLYYDHVPKHVWIGSCAFVKHVKVKVSWSRCMRANIGVRYEEFVAKRNKRIFLHFKAKLSGSADTKSNAFLMILRSQLYQGIFFEAMINSATYLFPLNFSSVNRKHLKFTKMELLPFATKLFIYVWGAVMFARNWVREKPHRSKENTAGLDKKV